MNIALLSQGLLSMIVLKCYTCKLHSSRKRFILASDVKI